MSRLLALPFVVLLAFATLAAACGGGGDDEQAGETATATESPAGDETPEGDAGALEVYFQEIAAIQDDFVGQGDALKAQFPDAFTEAEATRDYYGELVPTFRDFLNDLSDVDPPNEVEDAHGELLDSLGDLVEALEDFVDRLADAGSDSELEDLLNELGEDPEFTAATDRSDSACVDLQSIADDNEIAIDLECVEEVETIVLSLEEYFREIDRVFAYSDIRIDTFNTELDQALSAATTVEEQVDSLRFFLNETNRVLFDSAFELGGLEPPPEVVEFHNDFLDQVEAAAQLSQDFLARLPDVATAADLEALVDEFDFDISAATAKADDACFELQSIADDNGINVDLDCED